MPLYPIIGSITTVVAFVTFVGILVWALGPRRRGRFAEAAQAPFALPDEIPAAGTPPVERTP